MKLLKKYGLFLFWVALILDCTLAVYNNVEYRVYTKSFLIPILALYFYLNTNKSRHALTKAWVYISLLISCVSEAFFLYNGYLQSKSDVLQKHTGDIYLVMAVIGLLCTFVFYGMLFNKMNKINIKDCQEAFIAMLCMAIVGFVFYKFLTIEKIEQRFKYLVLTSIIIMALVMGLAANIYKNKIRKNMAYQYFMPGFLILSISVYIVFTYRFLLKDAEFLPPVIVLTYGFGQMLIVRGLTKYLKA